MCLLETPNCSMQNCTSDLTPERPSTLEDLHTLINVRLLKGFILLDLKSASETLLVDPEPFRIYFN